MGSKSGQNSKITKCMWENFITKRRAGAPIIEEYRLILERNEEIDSHEFYELWESDPLPLSRVKYRESIWYGEFSFAHKAFASQNLGK